MKVDLKDIEHINKAMQNIDGWILKDCKFWETASGVSMATIRLEQIERKKQKRYLEEENHE